MSKRASRRKSGRKRTRWIVESCTGCDMPYARREIVHADGSYSCTDLYCPACKQLQQLDATLARLRLSQEVWKDRRRANAARTWRLLNKVGVTQQ